MRASARVTSNATSGCARSPTTTSATHDEKPAIWIDANIHATELTGSLAALYLINKLLSQYGKDDTVTRALDTRTFYIVPRMGPDGAELAMAERPRYIRSSAREYPRTDQQDGLIAQDMDGDGRILTMRIPDPNGTWKVSTADHRLLVPREPEEDGAGPYYRLLTEGEIQNYDGVTVKYAPTLAGLDMNRNYPIEWRPEGEQTGAGPYPTSEPEIRAVVQAIVDRPNICAFIQYHTMSGVHLRPYGTKSDEGLPTIDLRVFKKIGEKATELTGYPAVSVYHDFKYDPKDVITGVADDWAYDHLGVHAWTTEFWSPQGAAGITDYKFIEWGIDHPFDDDLKMLAWSDEQLNGEGFVDWYAYDHPQLGPVELGGWNTAYCWRNPPPHLLEKEVAPHADWAIWHILISPLPASPHGRSREGRRRHVACALRRAEHGLAADERHAEGDRAQDRAARRARDQLGRRRARGRGSGGQRPQTRGRPTLRSDHEELDDRRIWWRFRRDERSCQGRLDRPRARGDGRPPRSAPRACRRRPGVSHPRLVNPRRSSILCKLSGE